jgi:general secretion pathway protein M
MIGAWWHGLAAQERRVLVVGGIVAALLLGWALLWHPLEQRRAELERELDRQREELAFVQAGAQEIARRRATGVQAGAQRAGKSLLALADATARSGGLGDALRRVEPAGARTVKLAFESARFDVLVAWIEALATSYGVEAVELSVDRADGVGFVNARVTLQDAP